MFFVPYFSVHVRWVCVEAQASTTGSSCVESEFLSIAPSDLSGRGLGPPLKLLNCS